MRRRSSILLALVGLAALPALARSRPQDTGFLNRKLAIAGVTYKYNVYLPEEWNSKRKWPVILFLHGSGERGSDGLDQTQVGLPAALRAHPERWPFIVVMPQVPYSKRHWTDPEMMSMAISALDAEVHEFHGDPQHVYLTGISLGGYGTWEVARTYPGKFAAVIPVCGGIFWPYAPDRWRQPGLAEEYAKALGRTAVWMFHGADDPVVVPKQSEIMFEAIKAARGDVRLWEYAEWQHNVWEKAYSEPDLPRWLLAHSLATTQANPVYAERTLVPIHPVPAKVDPAIYNAYVGEYMDSGVVQVTITRQGDGLFSKNRIGQTSEILPENPTTFFYPHGGSSRIVFEKDAAGQVKEILFRDDRHEEHWQKKR